MGIENRGFASMDREKRRELARRGGEAAHRLGRAHEWTREEARAAARKGHAQNGHSGGSDGMSRLRRARARIQH
jgi:uncharacterized protein